LNKKKKASSKKESQVANLTMLLKDLALKRISISRKVKTDLRKNRRNQNSNLDKSKRRLSALKRKKYRE